MDDSIDPKGMGHEHDEYKDYRKVAQYHMLILSLDSDIELLWIVLYRGTIQDWDIWDV